MEVSRMLAKNIVNVDYRTFSPVVIEMTKKLVLDGLACAMAGSSAVGMTELAKLVREWGGKEESSVVVFGDRVPSFHAALVNGSMGRALDFDDTHDVALLHPAVPVVFAGFAIAEHKGGVSGKEFITAVALGIDLSCRMSKASPVGMLEGYGWDYSVIYGYFSAAAAGAKILGLGEDGMLNAMGIAYHQSSGTMCQFAQGYTTKGMGSGFAASGGVVSALMAEKGLTGSTESLSGKWGIYNLFHRGDYIPEYLTGDLGKYFMVEDDSIKPYPCCRCMHAANDATLALVKENNIKPEDIESVTVTTGVNNYATACEPLELKQNPPNAVASQFSMPWSVANAIIHRKVEIKHFSDEALKNREVHQMALKVTMKSAPNLTRKELEPSVVEIETKGGKVYSKRVDYALGSPQNPMSMEGMVDKFRSCAGYAARPVAKEKLDQAVQMVKGLEDVTDVGQIVRLLA